MKYIFFLLLPLMLISCIKRVPLVEEKQFEKDYKTKRNILHNQGSDFFTKLENSDLDSVKCSYLKYLFAYMPLSDFADYEFEFYEKQVNYAMLTRVTFPWAKDIPEDIFIHYVLPPRVNNENLDTARMVFYRELKDRLLPMNLSMEEAALEINHWCHEKITYRGTDERTISPLGAMRSGFGRCGEESTFAVTALRAAGIPARQVYTPRWVHTDDNHAWVEVWIDGKWFFLGACEPAPVLNTGWFAVPATRTMLVHTKQFGADNTTDEANLSYTDNYVWKSTLRTYAPVKKIIAEVVDENNLPVWGADVQFSIYNYAEMYPLHSCKTNVNGMAIFETGYGSLEVCASFENKTASVIVEPDQKGVVKIVLGTTEKFPPEDCVYIPPVAGDVMPVDIEKEKENALRLVEEDKIRFEFESGFYDDRKVRDFTVAFGYPKESGQYLLLSKGNYQEIENFLIEYSYKDMRTEALNLLSILPEKDLRDTRTDILTEHLDYSLKFKDKSLPDSVFVEYVLNPRIAFEMLKPYRAVIVNSLDSTEIVKFQNNPAQIRDYILSEIAVNSKSLTLMYSGNDLNAYRVPISPAGVHKLKLCDDKSLVIYYVAFCRSIGIPARIDPASASPQYFFEGNWNDVVLSSDSDSKEIKRSKLFLNCTDTSRELKYRIHFSLARLENGFFNTVDLGWEIPISDFADGLDLPIGQYMLLTAIRNEDGSVIVKRKYFELSENTIIRLNITMPEMKSQSENCPSFNHAGLTDKFNSTVSSVGFIKTGKYVAYCWLDPGKEPSKHIVRDLSPMMSELAKNNITVVYLIKDLNFKPVDFGFPADMKYYFDTDHKLLYSNTTCKTSGAGHSLPLIMLVNSESKTIFSSEGYTIAVGEMLINKVSGK